GLLLFLRGALGAGAEHLDRVRYVAEAVLCGDGVRPALDGGARDLDGPAAVAADQVVVVLLGAAGPVDGLALVGAQHVDLARVAERLQRPVHGRETDLGAVRAQVGVDVLCAAEPFGGGQHLPYRVPAGRRHPPCTSASASTRVPAPGPAAAGRTADSTPGAVASGVVPRNPWTGRRPARREPGPPPGYAKNEDGCRVRRICRKTGIGAVETVEPFRTVRTVRGRGPPRSPRGPPVRRCGAASPSRRARASSG